MKITKYMKSMVWILTAMLLVGQLGTGTVEAQAARRAKLSTTHLSLTVGQTKKLKVKNAKKVTWKSSKKSVATVTQKGVVKAKKKGSATITAKVGKRKFRCKVTVRNGKNKSSILVAYFSWSGTSEKIAKQIIAQTGGDAYRIERNIPYSEDYSTVANEAKKEMEKNERPAIKNPLASVSKYKKIILCYPIWWHTAPMTIGTFLEGYDWTGKTIYPVSQSASMDRSQYNQSVAFIKKCAKGAKVDNGLFSASSSKIQSYINQI